MRGWMVAVVGGLMAGGVGAGAQSVAPAVTAPLAVQVQKVETENARMTAELEDWAQLGRYRAADEALPATEPGRVVFYGDSITDAWVANGGKFFPGKPYVNRGISGQTTPQMLVRFRQDVVDMHPEAVVILAGTNDIAGNTGPSTQGMIEDNFKGMVEIARANGIRVILASVLPSAGYPWRTSVEHVPEKIEAMNVWLKGYCAQEKITYLDYWDAMAGPDGGMKPGISIDGVHPNAKGYAIMEPLAEAALAEK
ncbi:MAG: SGNH/GDSL hydrolase family protein [Acidobacteriaceae bacterium]